MTEDLSILDTIAHGREVLGAEHVRIAREMVAELHAHDGMIPLDLDRFHEDNAKANSNPWGDQAPQMPLGLLGWGMLECVFDELGIPEDYKRWNEDQVWRCELNKSYNDRAERFVGRRMLFETASDTGRSYPPVKELHDIFEARNEWHAGSWWLMPSANNRDELVALLDRVEAIDLRAFLLPENWEQEKTRLMAEGIKPALYRAQRGPVTFAASIYGVENLLMLIQEEPDLAARFRDVILKTMLERARILDEEAGYTPETAPHGFMFLDDNCYLLSPPMYEFFAFPILQAIFARYSPNPGDNRYQHSDSPMGHLLPLFGRLNMTGVNFGPTLSAREIREHLPGALIHGQLAPYTFSRNEEEQIVLECLRDFELSREKRGLVFTTAGSVNNGSRLSGLRLIMATIQRHCRYDG